MSPCNCVHVNVREGVRGRKGGREGGRERKGGWGEGEEGRDEVMGENKVEYVLERIG